MLLYRAVINRFQGTEEFQLQSLSVQALIRSGAVLTRLGRLQEAADANQAIFKYGEGAVAALEPYAVGTRNEAIEKDWPGRSWQRPWLSEHFSAGRNRHGSERVLARFQDDTSPVIQAIVAKAHGGLNEVVATDDG